MGKPPKLYSEGVAKEIGSELDHLAQNPKGLQTKELVFQMLSRIEAAQASGHTLEDILNVFKGKGVDLTLNTLKQYLRESRALTPSSDPPKPPSSDQKPPKSKKSSSSTADSLEQSPKPTQPEVNPPLEIKEEGKLQLTNTNADGFQEMRDDDDL